MNVLFIDDEAVFLETLMKRMKKRNINVTGTDSGKQALALLNRNHADVVVMNVKNQGMYGIQTLKEIKLTDSLVEVIMLTGYASLEVAQLGMELGAFDFLVKPVDIDELLHKIQDAYKQKMIQENKIKKIKQMIQKLEKKAFLK
ncbi:response regulator [Desulfococcaceae bacterium HSG9]|nr:response regulator [Desulfococcaceae bacterium HSG9]